MNHLTDWIKHHQITAFFAITFAITWGLGFSYGAVYQRNQYLLLPFAFAATCGPALAGIVVTAITNAQPRHGKRISFWIAFGAAWIIAVLVCLANLKFIEHVPISPALVILFTIAMLPVPLIIASAYSRNPSVRRYLASLIRLRGVWGWALLARARTAHQDDGLLGSDVRRAHPALPADHLALQPGEREHPGGRYCPCGCQYRPGVHFQPRLGNLPGVGSDRFCAHPGRPDVEETAPRSPGNLS